ncbi:MAG: hypothetical protein QM621_01940 [Aeromicrobium sp.]|uniref:hypothetical protein n=1 Tax=Aeromicrobium sp. TaxID=1871063 RepID=UPI0039E60587
MDSRGYLRRSLRSSIILRLLILGLVAFVLWFLSMEPPEENDDPSPQATTDPRLATDEIERDIAAQGGATYGQAIVVTCPDKIETVEGRQMTCVVAEADGTVVADALVTVTNPGLSAGVQWAWESVMPPTEGLLDTINQQNEAERAAAATPVP